MGTPPPAIRGFFRTLRNLNQCRGHHRMAEKWAETLHTLQTPAMTRVPADVDPATACISLHMSGGGLPVARGMLRIDLDSLNVDSGRIPMLDDVDVQRILE